MDNWQFKIQYIPKQFGTPIIVHFQLSIFNSILWIYNYAVECHKQGTGSMPYFLQIDHKYSYKQTQLSKHLKRVSQRGYFSDEWYTSIIYHIGEHTCNLGWTIAK